MNKFPTIYVAWSSEKINDGARFKRDLKRYFGYLTKLHPALLPSVMSAIMDSQLALEITMTSMRSPVLDGVIHDILNLFKKSTGVLEDGEVIVNVSMDSAPIEVSQFVVSIAATDTLHGIDKIIIAADNLQIEFPSYIDTGLSSLFDINHVGRLLFNSEGQPWDSIVRSYFTKRTGRNKLEFQKDMIKAGLKSYL